MNRPLSPGLSTNEAVLRNEFMIPCWKQPGFCDEALVRKEPVKSKQFMSDVRLAETGGVPSPGHAAFVIQWSFCDASTSLKDHAISKMPQVWDSQQRTCMLTN